MSITAADGPGGGFSRQRSVRVRDGNKHDPGAKKCGCDVCLGPDDPGYARETSGFDLGIACLPDVAVAARTPADVAATVAVAAERGERLTVLGSGHGRRHDVHGGVAIT